MEFSKLLPLYFTFDTDDRSTKIIKLYRKDDLTFDNVIDIIGGIKKYPEPFQMKLKEMTFDEIFQKAYEHDPNNMPLRLWMFVDEYNQYFRWFDYDPTIFHYSLDVLKNQLDPFQFKPLEGGRYFNIVRYCLDKGLDTKEFLKGFSLFDIENVRRFVSTKGDMFYLNCLSNTDCLTNFTEQNGFYFPNWIVPKTDIPGKDCLLSIIPTFDTIQSYLVKKRKPKLDFKWKYDKNSVIQFKDYYYDKKRIYLSTMLKQNIPNHVLKLYDYESIMELKFKSIDEICLVFHTRQSLLKVTKILHPIYKEYSRLEVFVNALKDRNEKLKVKIYKLF